MERKIFLLICNFLFGLLLVKAQLPVDHNLRLVLNQTTSGGHIELLGGSDVFIGTITDQVVSMDEIATQEDGEITFELVYLDSLEDLAFRLLNVADTTEHFTLKFLNQTLILSEQYQGQSLTTAIGSYAIGDVFRILRCGYKINYTINGQLVYVKELSSNDFALYGEVIVQGPTGIDLEAIVTFHPL